VLEANSETELEANFETVLEANSETELEANFETVRS
jgi:hypothetical protein